MSLPPYSLKAIFGGTFDPPHLGHLRPLLSLLDTLNLDHCDIVPSHIPVHKQTQTAAAHRLKMCGYFAQADSRLQVNDIEIKHDRPSFSSNTLAELAQTHPNTSICFILGLDAFLGLASWHKSEVLFKQCHFIVMMRDEDSDLANELTGDGYSDASIGVNSSSLRYLPASLQALLPETIYLCAEQGQKAQNQHINGILRASKHGEVVFFMNKVHEVSSTQVRHALARGDSIKHYLLPEVADYIQEHSIYKTKAED
ncbi:nicotinate-nicotinamide nucleotide adenylyltransferase [Glaciecola siphonariae]|uniref:Probable nicotinate-nucleotide adenylyltransferase n=1 Tax=Glaciecola siphonariae TaxID=521012 RepID=A0ABV9LTB7_9ALTE